MNDFKSWQNEISASQQKLINDHYWAIVDCRAVSLICRFKFLKQYWLVFKAFFFYTICRKLFFLPYSKVVFGAMFFSVKTTRVKLSVWLDEMNWTDTVVLKKLFYQITSEYPMVMVERTAQQSFTFIWSTETITTGLKVASINFTDFISCSFSFFFAKIVVFCTWHLFHCQLLFKHDAWTQKWKKSRIQK